MVAAVTPEIAGAVAVAAVTAEAAGAGAVAVAVAVATTDEKRRGRQVLPRYYFK